MKKILFASAIAALCLSLAACNKDNPQSEEKSGPVAVKVEFQIEWSGVSAEIINDFDITCTGKDFKGSSFSLPLKAANGSRTFVSGDVEIKDTRDHCPFTYACTVVPKKEFPEKDSYECNYNFAVKCRYYDAQGNALDCGSGETEDIIINARASGSIVKKGEKSAKNFFQETVTYAFRESETTYVFFRNSADFSFGHASAN